MYHDWDRVRCRSHCGHLSTADATRLWATRLSKPPPFINNLCVLARLPQSVHSHLLPENLAARVIVVHTRPPRVRP